LGIQGLPLVQVPYLDRKRIEDATNQLLIREGENAYNAGFPIDRCPPFSQADMAVTWRLGWRHGHERDWQLNHRRGAKRCDNVCRGRHAECVYYGIDGTRGGS